MGRWGGAWGQRSTERNGVGVAAAGGVNGIGGAVFVGSNKIGGSGAESADVDGA